MSNAPASSKPTAVDRLISNRSGADVSLWPRRLIVFILVALAGITADVLTKWLIFEAHFRPGNPPVRTWLITDILGIETTTNPGALFGMLPGYHIVFAALSIVVLVGIVWWLFCAGAARDAYLNVTLGMIAGGILGNLYDRLGFGYRPEYPESIKHHVRDWILFQWRGVRFLDPWPNFNIADSLLVCGAILLVVHSIFLARPGQAPTESTLDSGDSGADVRR